MERFRADDSDQIFWGYNIGVAVFVEWNIRVVCETRGSEQSAGIA
jgi:hypothetical protein